MRTVVALFAVFVLAGCASDSASLPQRDEPAKLDPADFVEGIDNPYWPMAPGSTWLYREGDQRVGST